MGFPSGPDVERLAPSAARRSVASGDGVQIASSEIIALVEQLEELGVKFTVVPRLDGSPRLNTWRMQNSWLNRDRVNQLLAERIERSPETAAQIAELIGEKAAEDFGS